jgi:hypothetical protein
MTSLNARVATIHREAHAKLLSSLADPFIEDGADLARLGLADPDRGRALYAATFVY